MTPDTFSQAAAVSPDSGEAYLESALAALDLRNRDRWAALDAIPVPVYLTDPDGCVTFWNKACTAFAGREPQLGKDRWCVTWAIHTTNDEVLPHEACPMAIAIKEQRPIRGEVAIAMRPDGSRKAFTPYPTPLFDRDGELIGAINLLIDVSEQQVDALAEQAARCRRLSDAFCDRSTAGILRGMAAGFEVNAAALRSREVLTPLS